MLVYVCAADVAEVVVAEEDVSLTATAEAPRTVGGKKLPQVLHIC